jgi:NADH-quinone oxidoreductase subunit N
MYFDAPQDQHPIRPELDMRLLLSFNGLLLLAFGIAPEPVLMLCSRAIFQSL